MVVLRDQLHYPSGELLALLLHSLWYVRQSTVQFSTVSDVRERNVEINCIGHEIRGPGEYNGIV
jgi:hypothetical protein